MHLAKEYTHYCAQQRMSYDHHVSFLVWRDPTKSSTHGRKGERYIILKLSTHESILTQPVQFGCVWSVLNKKDR
jgi:hypothetical protein